MGILNATPDSFHDGSRVNGTESAVQMAAGMVAAGADLLDIGGQSTRPGAETVGPEVESRRVIPVIRAVRKNHPDLAISVDTHWASVAAKALDAGADIVNDISAATWDPAMPELLARRGAPCIIMHMQGTPATMQDQPQYTDVVREVRDYLAERIATLRALGVEQIGVDPGFGFGKTRKHNYRLLDELGAFSTLGCPVLAGVSRKSMIYKALDCTPAAALNGTTALHAWALDRGAHILRTHDVAEAVECVKLHGALRTSRLTGPHD